MSVFLLIGRQIGKGVGNGDQSQDVNHSVALHRLQGNTIHRMGDHASNEDKNETKGARQTGKSL